jgi:hypothetical protein
VGPVGALQGDALLAGGFGSRLGLRPVRALAPGAVVHLAGGSRTDRRIVTVLGGGPGLVASRIIWSVR